MVSVLCDFLYKNWWNSKNSHCFYTKIHSLPLTFSENQGSERPELTGSKMALLFLPVHRNLEIHALHEIGWKWVFFKGSCSWAIWGLRHLAMIVARGVALSELTEQRCSVSCFEPGLVIRLSPWSLALFCTTWFLLCRAMRVHKKIGQCSRIS